MFLRDITGKRRFIKVLGVASPAIVATIPYFAHTLAAGEIISSIKAPLDTPTYTVVATSPQLGLSGDKIVRGNAVAVAGQNYSITVRATSVKGKSTETILRFACQYSSFTTSITATADGSVGQTYTALAAMANVRWARRTTTGALSAQIATGPSYVATDADIGNRLVATGTIGGVTHICDALHVVADRPVLLEGFDSISGFTPVNGAVLSIETAGHSQGAGQMVIQGTGVANSGFTKADIGTHDPATWGTIAQIYDAGWNPVDTTSYRLNFTRGSTNYPSALNYPLTPVFQTPQPLFYGRMVSSQHVSELSGLAAAGTGQFGISQNVTGVNANYAYNSRRVDALVARAGGRPSVVLGFDDNFDTQFSIAFPYLSDRAIKANVHVVQNYVGQSGRLTLDNLSDLYSAGWDMCLNTSDDGALTSKGSVENAVANLLQCRDWLAANGMERGGEFFCYPNGSYQNSPTRPLTTITANGSNVVVVANASNIVLGMTMAGYNVPANTTVTAIAGTSITVSQNVPTMTGRAVNFVDLASPFSYTKLPLALKAAGLKMGRTTQNRGGFLSRFGIGDRGGILAPGNGTSATTLDALKASIDLAILRGETIEFYTHSLSTAGGVQTDPAKWFAFIDYITEKRDAGLLDVLTKTELWARDGGASLPLPR